MQELFFLRLEEGSRKWEEHCVRYAAVESICVLKATHNLLSVRASKTTL